MKPSPRKKKGDGGGVNQRKITSFFVKLDPNAPRQANPADLRQTKLLNCGVSRESSASSSSNNVGARSTSSRSKRTRTKKKQRAKLVSTKVIPEDEVITILSDDSNDGINGNETLPNETGSTQQIAGCSNGINITKPTAFAGETEKIQTQDEVNEDETRNPDGFTSSLSILNTHTHVSEQETQLIHEDEEETQVDEIEDKYNSNTMIRENSSEGDDASRCSSPSLLTNCSSQVLACNFSQGGSEEVDNERTTDGKVGADNDDSIRFDDIEVTQLDDYTLNAVDSAVRNDEDETQIRLIHQENSKTSPSPCSSSSTTQGSISVTPLKNLLEKSPVKSEERVFGQTTPLKHPKTPKSKALYFSPVRHLRNSPNKNSPGKGQGPNNQFVNLYSSPNKNSPGKGQFPNNQNINNSSNNSPSKYNSPTIAQSSTNNTNPTQYSSLPYFLEHFVDILNTVTKDQHNSHLFNEDDLAIIHNFNELNTDAKCLYIKLFQRQWSWKPASNIKYPKIAENLLDIFEKLYSCDLLLKLGGEVQGKPELPELLHLLHGDQIVALVKDMGLKIASKTKEASIDGLVNLTKNQRTLSGSGQDIVYKAALKILGPTYKVSPKSKNLFSRIFILYSPPQYWEEETDQGSNQLLTALLSKQGKMQYASYKISKRLKVYPTRDDLLRFQDGWSSHSSIQSYIDPKVKDWDSAQDICEEAVEQFKVILQNNDIRSHDETLPLFLRAFTAGSVFSRSIFLGIDSFQKRKNYRKANEIIKLLLDQTLYMPQYRGRWFERLIINLKHLKTPDSELRATILRGLGDEFLQDSHRLSLTQKLEKLKSAPEPKQTTSKKRSASASSDTKRRKSKRIRNIIESSDEEEEEEENSNEPGTSDELVDQESALKYCLKNTIPSRTIEGEKMEIAESRGGKSSFIGPNSVAHENGNSVSSVESFAIEYYKKHGYTSGVHSEGSLPVAIFGLIFWDIIFYDEIPDIFYSPYQPFPLDLHFEDFYNQREELIDQLLQNLRFNWSLNDAFEVIERNWENHLNKLSVVNWGVFGSVDDVKSLVRSMGLQLVAALCERLCKNFRHFRSGFPDLILWNNSTYKCLFVEVKGPGDTLSSKQSLWLDFLVSVNANVEVCHVKAVSNKRIRTS